MKPRVFHAGPFFWVEHDIDVDHFDTWEAAMAFAHRLLES